MKAPSTHTSDRVRMLWAFAITSIALFMTTLDNLVVTTALPVIRHDLHASLSGLEWMVNAYTLTFAVLLLTGAALGDRFGRRRLFAIGLAIFTGGWALAALAGSANELIAARAIQGLGGAIVLPLTLTILSAAVPPNRRGVALGAWGGIGGLAVALGPLVGGVIVQGISWQWIFWLNVPFGLVLIPLALSKLQETHGSWSRLDLRGLALSAAALLATGLAWIGAILTTTLPYSSIVVPFALSGIGMALYFAPVANVVLSSVKPDEEGQASGANNAIRELGGVFGVAVMAAVFSHYGGYQTPASFVHGVTPALYVGAAIVAVGAAAALFIPRRRTSEAEVAQLAPTLERLAPELAAAA